MKLILIISFAIFSALCSKGAGLSPEYSYFSETELKAILDEPSKNTQWPDRVAKYRDFLLRPNIEKYKEYRSVLQLEDDKDLEKYSYNAYPTLDITKTFTELFGGGVMINEILVGTTFPALCNEIESVALLASAAERVERFYVKDNSPQIAENYADDQELEAFKGDTDLAYTIRRLLYGISKAAGKGAGKWEVLCKVLGTFDYADWESKTITLNIAYKILNLCFLANDTRSEAFGTKVMKLVSSINADPRVKSNNLGINYFKLDVSGIFDDADDVYLPLFVPQNSRLVYGPMGIVKYIMNGEMGMPIARVYGDKGFNLKGNEIVDAPCLLAPAKGLINSIPLGPIAGKKESKDFGDVSGSVKYPLEVYTRLSNDVTFEELGKLLCTGNLVVANEESLDGMIITNNTKERISPIKGGEREDNQVYLHDTIAMLLNPVKVDDVTKLNEQLICPTGIEGGGWYGNYTIYHLPLEEIKGQILNAPIESSNPLSTADGIIVEAAPKGDIGEKIPDVSKYWNYNGASK